MAKFLAEQTVKNFLSAIVSAFGSSSSGTGKGTTGTGGLNTGGNYGYAHTGGVMGVDYMQKRWVAALPKYHSGGLAHDEQVAVLRRNEGIFTPGQMKALGDRSVNVAINVENKSSQPVNAKQGKTQFDGKKYIINVILEDINQGGVLRGVMG